MVNGGRTSFTNEETSSGKKCDETLTCQMTDFLIDNIYIKIGNHLFRQCIGIPMGTICAPLLANLFLYSYEVEFLRSMKKSNKKLAKAFNLTSRYTDDLINNPRFKQFLKYIYPEEPVVSETSESRNVVSYLDLLIDISNGDLVCPIFDKRDASDFDIVNFPDLSQKIPTASAYGTYISQLIRYSRTCHNFDNFSSMLAERLFTQGFSARKQIRTFYKFMGRYPELASKFNKSPSSMVYVVHKAAHAYSSGHLMSSLINIS